MPCHSQVRSTTDQLLKIVHDGTEISSLAEISQPQEDSIVQQQQRHHPPSRVPRRSPTLPSPDSSTHSSYLNLWPPTPTSAHHRTQNAFTPISRPWVAPNSRIHPLAEDSTLPAHSNLNERGRVHRGPGLDLGLEHEPLTRYKAMDENPERSALRPLVPGRKFWSAGY